LQYLPLIVANEIFTVVFVAHMSNRTKTEHRAEGERRTPDTGIGIGFALMFAPRSKSKQSVIFKTSLRVDFVGGGKCQKLVLC